MGKYQELDQEVVQYQQEKDQAAWDKRKKKANAITKRKNRGKNRHAWSNQSTETEG